MTATRRRTPPPVLTEDDVAEICGFPFDGTARQCHGVSLAIVRSGRVPGARVARGWCRGVLGQHSWVVDGPDCYARNARIIDATLWSYDPAVAGVWHGTVRAGLHRPHGAGSIWDAGRPPYPAGPPVALTPKTPFSDDALEFLDILGPLDHRGWMVLANGPMEEWPAAEIITAMDDTPDLRALVPIDILGMLTNRNPAGMYLPGPEREEA